MKNSPEGLSGVNEKEANKAFQKKSGDDAGDDNDDGSGDGEDTNAAAGDTQTGLNEDNGSGDGDDITVVASETDTGGAHTGVNEQHEEGWSEAALNPN